MCSDNQFLTGTRNKIHNIKDSLSEKEKKLCIFFITITTFQKWLKAPSEENQLLKTHADIKGNKSC